MLDLIQRATISPNSEYPDSLKKFALTMHFYSPSAYQYLRKCLNMSLPHVNTIRKWRNSVDGSPGFTPEAFLALEKRVSLSRYPIYASVTFDEMSIKKPLSGMAIPSWDRWI